MPRFCIIFSARANQTVVKILGHTKETRSKLREFIQEILSTSASLWTLLFRRLASKAVEQLVFPFSNRVGAREFHRFIAGGAGAAGKRMASPQIIKNEIPPLTIARFREEIRNAVLFGKRPEIRVGVALSHKAFIAE